MQNAGERFAQFSPDRRGIFRSTSRSPDFTGENSQRSALRVPVTREVSPWNFSGQLPCGGLGPNLRCFQRLTKPRLTVSRCSRVQAGLTVQRNMQPKIGQNFPGTEDRCLR